MLQINEMAMCTVVQARQQRLADSMEASQRRSAIAARLGVALIRMGEALQQGRPSSTDLVGVDVRPRLSQG